MNIASAEAVLTPLSRNSVTLRLTTGEGVVGPEVELDEQGARAHPHQPSHLPVRHLRDGTVHDW